jgi:Inner membrane component of T3SS, cytoplasmic domain
MSFRYFVYWCALCGGWAAAAGWALGRLIAGNDSLGATGLKGMCLGLLIALGLGLVDALWVFSLRQFGRVLPRVLVGVLVGSVGGLVGGFVGQALVNWQFLQKHLEPLITPQHQDILFQVFGWVLTGLMVGVSIGAYDFLRTWVREEELSFPLWKVLRGGLGGVIGGLLGGVLFWKLGDAGNALFPGKSDLWMPSLTGFIALGLCIGLLIGVAQVVLKEAWLRVEKGFRQGRELLVNKPVLTIGRAESCDIGLFGDPQIEKLHARIYQQDDRYVIADAGSAHGTFVNDLRVQEPTPLCSGDLIRVGSAYLRFSERKKR